MSFIPSSKSTIGYRVDGFDVTVALGAPLFALWIRDLDAIYAIAPTTLFAYVGVSFFLSVVYFIWFHVGRGLPNYFSVQDALQIAKAALCIVISSTTFVFVFTRTEGFPRSVPIIHFFILLAVLSSSRLIQRKLVLPRDFPAENPVAHENEEHIFIVGAGTLASLYVRFLESGSGRRQIAAILDDDRSLHGRSILGYSIMGDIQEIPALIDDYEQHGVQISAVVVCDADRERASGYRERLGPICSSRGLQIEMLAEAPAIFGGATAAPSRPSSTVNSVPIAGYFQAKRAVEPVFAAFCLIACLPLFVLTGLVAFVSLGWPVIFWQRRIGRNGRTLFVYKFKTMRNPITRSGRRLTIQERHTRVGKMLRSSRLDEIPQLISVIKGDMSIIGPRPLLPVDQPAEASLRLAVAPGLTGWAQIHGGKLITREEKTVLDEWYVRNASFRVDAEIAWRTILTMVIGDRRNNDQLEAALVRANIFEKKSDLIQTPLGLHGSPNS